MRTACRNGSKQQCCGWWLLSGAAVDSSSAISSSAILVPLPCIFYVLCCHSHIVSGRPLALRFMFSLVSNRGRSWKVDFVTPNAGQLHSTALEYASTTP